jgi:hypothetical protein
MLGIFSTFLRREEDRDGGAGRYGYASVNKCFLEERWFAYSYEPLSLCWS